MLQGQRDQPRRQRIAGLRGLRRLVVTLDRLSVGIQHATHRIQRLHFAIGGEELVELRHRERALIDRAEDQRWIRFGIDAGQYLDDLHHAIEAHVDADPYRGLIVGLRERIHHADAAVTAAIGVARRPALAVGLGHRDRRVLHHRRQRIAAGLGQREQIHERLEQRTDRTLGVERAIEIRLGEFATAHHRHNPSGAGVGNHHARFQRRAVLALRFVQCRLDRILGIDLRGRIQRGVDDQAGATQFVGRIVALQLPPHQIHERGITIGDDARMRADAQRRGLGAREFIGLDQAGFGENVQYHIAPRQRTIGITARIVVRGTLDQPDQQRDVLRRQREQRAAEPELGARAHAVYRLLALLREEDFVEVGLEDAPLVEARLDQQRVQGLVELALEAALAAQEQHSHQLLGNRAATLAHAAFARIHPQRANDAADIDAVMVLEIAILDRLQAADQQRRHILEPHQPAFFLVGSVQRRNRRRIELDHEQPAAARSACIQ